MLQEALGTAQPSGGRGGVRVVGLVGEAQPDGAFARALGRVAAFGGTACRRGCTAPRWRGSRPTTTGPRPGRSRPPGSRLSGQGRLEGDPRVAPPACGQRVVAGGEELLRSHRGPLSLRGTRLGRGPALGRGSGPRLAPPLYTQARTTPCRSRNCPSRLRSRKVAPGSHRAKPAARHHDASARHVRDPEHLVVSLTDEDRARARRPKRSGSMVVTMTADSLVTLRIANSARSGSVTWMSMLAQNTRSNKPTVSGLRSYTLQNTCSTREPRASIAKPSAPCRYPTARPVAPVLALEPVLQLTAPVVGAPAKATPRRRYARPHGARTRTRRTRGQDPRRGPTDRSGRRATRSAPPSIPPVVVLTVGDDPVAELDRVVPVEVGRAGSLGIDAHPHTGESCRSAARPGAAAVAFRALGRRSTS